MQMLIHSDGTLRCLYDETLDLNAIGRIQITRGSHVEPTDSSQWVADMSPVQGPKLGPFAFRSQALHAEREWLELHWLAGASPGQP